MGESQSKRPKSYKTEQEQIASDEELFDQAKVDPKKLDKLTLNKIIDACIVFGETLANIKLHKYQREFCERVVRSLVLGDGETITVLLCRQSGKSEGIASVIVSVTILLPLFAEYLESVGIKNTLTKYSRGLWCGVYAPDYERAGIIGKKVNNDLTSNTSKQILSEPEIGMHFPERLTSFTGKLPRNSFVNVKSGNKRVSIEGDTYHLLVTDETQEIDSYVIKKSMSPFLAATLGTTVHLGSTYPEKVYFYDVIHTNKKEDVKRTKKNRCHFETDYHEAQKYNKNYKKYIEKEKKKLGEYSDEFRMSYELYWPIEQGMFITEEFLENVLGKNYSVTNSDMFNVHTIGIDIGKKRDSTVVTILEVDYNNPIIVDPDSHLIRFNKKVKNWFEITGDNYDNQYYQICRFVDNYNWKTMVVDATGVGAPMCDRLAAKYNRGEKSVVPFVFSTPEKSRGYSLLYKELLAERIVFPNSPLAQRLRKHKKFKEQFINLTKQIKGGYIVVEHIDEKGFDDYPDSLMLAVIGAEDTSISTGVRELVDVNIFRTNKGAVGGTRKAPSFWQKEKNGATINFWNRRN